MFLTLVAVATLSTADCNAGGPLPNPLSPRSLNNTWIAQAQPDADAAAAEGELEDDMHPDAPRPSHRRRPEISQPVSPTIHSHDGKYYLTWGIVDWVLAGQLWAGALVTGIYAVLFAAFGGFAADYDRGFSGMAMILGGVSLGLGTAGGIVAWRAGRNVSLYRQLKAQSRPRRR